MTAMAGGPRTRKVVFAKFDAASLRRTSDSLMLSMSILAGYFLGA